MRLAEFKIASKLALAFSVLLLVVAGFSGVVFHNLQQVDAADAANQHVAKVLDAANRLGLATIEQVAATRGYLLNQDPARIERYQTEQKHFDQAASDLQALVQLPDMQEKLARTLQLAGEWHDTSAAKMLALAARAETLEEARAVYNEGTGVKQIVAFRAALEEFKADEEAVQEARGAANAAAKADAKLALGVGAGLAALLAVLVGWLLARSIATPVKTMTRVMLRLAEGDDTVEVPMRDRGDELGAMAKAVQVFKDSAIENKRLEAEAASSRAVQEAQRSRQSAIDNAKAEDLKNFVHDVEESFQSLAAGDLTARMSRPVAPEFEPIRTTFNESVAQLDHAIASVVSSIGAIRTGLSEINVASSDLSQRTEQQAASLEETVAALSQVTAGVNETAAGAEQARAAARSSQANAEKGGSVVERAVQAMSEIEKSSQQINQIIGVIDEIAFQTNLLALNAGVEAARAGEAGRGFAVVASEVRGLAQRSAEAAKEIKGLISLSREQVEAGVELVSASGNSLKGIVTQVGEMNQVVATIARSAKEQAVSLKEVSTAADQMDKVTQQNAAMVEQATAAAQALSQETDTLAQMMQRFKTKASSGIVPATGKITQRTMHATSRNVVRLRSAGSGGAALAAGQVTEAKGWENF